MAQVPHVVVIVLVIASVVDVRKGLRFQFYKQAEYRIGVVDGVQAFGVGRGKRALVYDAQRFGHVCGRYIIRSGEGSPVFGLHCGCRSVVYGNANRLCIGHHLPPGIFYHLG